MNEEPTPERADHPEVRPSSAPSIPPVLPEEQGPASEDEPVSSVPSVDDASAPPSVVASGGIREIFWQSRALAEARASAHPGSAEARRFLELGDRLLYAVPALRFGDGEQPARDLYVRSLRSSLTLPEEALTPAERLAAEALVDPSSSATTDELRDAAVALVRRADRSPIILGILARRWLRVGLALLTVIGLLVAGNYVWTRARLGPDLSAGKARRGSSVYPRFEPATHTVDGNVSAIIFHTNEEQNPWYEIDLGSEQSVARVVVTNRADCCVERAAPLIIERSVDGKKWEEVAKRQDVFSRWDASFRPKPTRYLRLTVQKRTWFHLERVTVHAK